MKTKILSFMVLAMSLYMTKANAQSWQGMTWKDGNEVVVAEQLNASQILLVAAGHEDAGYGYLFNVKKTGAESYDMTGTDKPLNFPKDKDGIAYAILKGENFNGAGINWKRKVVKGMDFILRYDKDGKLTSIMEENSLDLNEYAKDKIMTTIEGDYYDANGVKYKFMDNGTCLFKGRSTTYRVGNVYDSPEFVIIIEGEMYVLDLNTEGMLIYEAVTEGLEGGVMRGKPVCALIADKHTHRWPSTSAYPCSSYVLSLLDKDVLRLMRNEIYARYGWKFKDAELDSYFRKCDWYKPVSDNSKIKLTEKELLNVALISYYENR